MFLVLKLTLFTKIFYWLTELSKIKNKILLYELIIVIKKKLHDSLSNGIMKSIIVLSVPWERSGAYAQGIN